MPTRGRREFAQHAVNIYRSQTYSNRELIILDDLDDPSFPHGISGERINHVLAPYRMTIGAKRNICIQASDGEFIAHLDDDDYSSPDRIADQVIRLMESEKQVTGYCPMLFTDGSQWWEYSAGNPRYCVGSSLLYRREFASLHRFNETEPDEDNQFVYGPASQHIVVVPAGDKMFCRTHPNNTSIRQPGKNPLQWKPVEAPAWARKAAA